MLNKEKENIVFYPPKEQDQKNSNVFVKTNLKLQKDTCCCKKRALTEGQKKSNHKKSNEGIPSLLTAYTPQIDILVTALLNTMNTMLLQVRPHIYNMKEAKRLKAIKA